MSASAHLEAERLDASDPLASFRARFHLPRRPDGAEAVYLCGNSLGLMPKGARARVEDELDDWARLAVDGHFRGRTPWYGYHEVFRESGARLVGGLPGEVVMMNGLTANLHLMMATFYRPTPSRHKILVEADGFPSDSYAVESQIRWHGLDPARSRIVVAPRPGEHLLRTEDIEARIDAEGDAIALVLLSGVHFLTGQRFDLDRVAVAARRRGCRVGFDLAHAVGNVPLRLHDWDVDFAVWCSYKYLNAGPGAIGGCFVHERHGHDASLPRLAGWWGNDPATRFRMHLEGAFVPYRGAEGWQLSNPPILAMAPLRESLALFDEAGMDRLRAKSVALTGFLERCLDAIPGGRFEILTPRDPDARGCQLSIEVRARAREVFRTLEDQGFVGDFREPDVIRVAPVPLYNTFSEAARFAEAMGRALASA